MNANITEITVQLPTEISYWGDEATESDVTRILDNFEAMIKNEFRTATLEIRFERTPTPRGNGVHGDNEEACQDIFEWMQNNWVMAL